MSFSFFFNCNYAFEKIKYVFTYEERDVSLDTKAQEEMIAKSNQMGVPVIDIDGQVTVGFDKARLSELLHIK